MNKNKIFVFMGIFVLIGLCFSVYAKSSEKTDYNITLHGVELREGVTSNITLRVFVNEKKPSSGKTIFIVPGWTQTANTWGPFAEAIFNDTQHGPKVSRVVVIDMPGHGNSALPDNLVFGDLTLDDYAQATLVSLERLRKGYHIKPKTIIGHSQGGLIVQMMQQSLKDEGTNLEKELGIKKVVLLASVVPREINWSYRYAPYFDPATLANFFLVEGWNNPYNPYNPDELPLVAEFGVHWRLPDPIWREFFFTKLDDGLVSSKAPTPEEIAEKGYNAPEPLFATLQLVGIELFGTPFVDWPPYGPEDFRLNDDVRPSVDANIFDKKSGTALQIVSYTQDTLVRPEESRLLYEYLTGKDNGKDKDVVVIGANESHDAVHNLHTSDPEYLLDNIAGKVKIV